MLIPLVQDEDNIRQSLCADIGYPRTSIPPTLKYTHEKCCPIRVVLGNDNGVQRQRRAERERRSRAATTCALRLACSTAINPSIAPPVFAVGSIETIFGFSLVIQEIP